LYDSISAFIVVYFDPVKKFLSIGSVNDSSSLSDIKVTFSVIALFVIYDLQIENILVSL